MGKDPAFLFYPGDWLGGTMGMTFEQKGVYLELLIYQFNNGPFTLAEAEHMLGTCKAYAKDMLLRKFTHVDGKYYNERLADEIDKRRRYSESRKLNAKTKKKAKESDSICSPYGEHMENENRNNTVFGIKNKKESQLSIKKVYAKDRIKIIYDLREWFKHTGQLEALELAGLTRFDEFMDANPAGIFDDDRHLYNAFRKFCKDTPRTGYTLKDLFPDRPDDD